MVSTIAPQQDVLIPIMTRRLPVSISYTRPLNAAYKRKLKSYGFDSKVEAPVLVGSAGDCCPEQCFGDAEDCGNIQVLKSPYYKKNPISPKATQPVL